MTLYSTGLRHPQLNGVMWMGPGDLGARIGEARRCFADLPWLWWVGPDSVSGTLDVLIDQGGFRVGVSPVMAIRTDMIAPLPHPQELTIERLPPDADLTAWVRTYVAPMGIADDQIPAMIRAEQARTDPPGSLVRFAARMDGEIVAVSELLMRDGVAGIYLVATDAAWRRRGLGAAVTAAAVRLGGQLGARIATLQATPAGQHLYRRLGFVTVSEYRIMSFPPL
ncbi:GNAT family N-acetyltransferase [Allosphingosinicella deserti]|uniref:GNAT family N-acetyltransferase n=1 Tax=Allosphingosinicella deserti TaxID=2116704 RepID=A0A2P7QSR7_9SPHN|nr:GNAT family N-acetyltransferase [Sphingomonas deserti]PSJ41009.1 GNAT family N-acetyltransferase [Sphingomonas deserti]